MNKLLILILLALAPCIRPAAQQTPYSADIQTLGGYVSPDRMPFWLRANQFGSIPVDGPSVSLIASAQKKCSKERKGKFDWAAGFAGRINAGGEQNFRLLEGYAKARYGIVELMAGRNREITGLCDTILSSGSFSISGTTPGIPRVQLSIPEFYTIPWFGGLFAFKGNFAHGWLGEAEMYARVGGRAVSKTYLHQVTLYGRFGKPQWRLKLYGGFNHQTLWGDGKVLYGDYFTLNTFQTYLYVISGKRFDNGPIQRVRLGNHVGSIDVGAEYAFDGVKLMVYRQNFYDAGALYYLANIEDGLNGLSITNTHNSQSLFRWKKILFEFLYTKNQAGEPWSPFTTSPYEAYYNHGEFVQGWSYGGIVMGTPFISTRDYLREGLNTYPGEYVVNNRVKVFHLGFQGSIQQWDYAFKASWSQNFGTWRTTDEEQSTNIPNPGDDGIFGRQDQFSGYFEFGRPLANGWHVGCLGAFDSGKLFEDGVGVMVGVGKAF